VGCRLGLSQLALPGILVGTTSAGRNLIATLRPSLLVLSQVNLAHTAAPELLDDAVMRDGFADHLREYYVGETSKSMKSTGVT